MEIGDIVEIKDLDVSFNSGFISSLNQRSSNFIGRINKIDGRWVQIIWIAYDYNSNIIWWHEIEGVNIKKISLIYCDE